MTTAISAERWVTRAEARRGLSVGNPALNTLVKAGEIRVRRLPGVPDRYSWSDIERLANQALSDEALSKG